LCIILAVFVDYFSSICGLFAGVCGLFCRCLCIILAVFVDYFTGVCGLCLLAFVNSPKC